MLKGSFAEEYCQASHFHYTWLGIHAVQHIPEECVTNFNGDGGEHSPIENRSVEAHSSSKEAPKESVSFQG